MGFRMSDDTRHFFRFLTEGQPGNRFDTLFDAYYLCLMAGLIRKRPGQESGAEFVQQFPEKFYNQRFQLIALLVSSELALQGVNIRRSEVSEQERVNVEREVLRMVNHQDPTQLSTAGLALMNSYADGGAQLIREHWKEEPRVLHAFLVEYHRWVGQEA